MNGFECGVLVGEGGTGLDGAVPVLILDEVPPLELDKELIESFTALEKLGGK